MAYFFRIHTGAETNADRADWHRTSLIKNDKTGIQSILDAVDQLPSSGKIGTSIPTPFARIYLFNAAFQAVVNSRNSGKCSKSYEQLVSDCLDLMQFLFEKGNDQDLKLYDINIKNLVTALHHSPYEQEKVLGDSLEIESKGEFANKSIMLIEYKGILLGGTSPFTIVYTSPNLRREIRTRSLEAEFTSNDKKPFWSGQNLDLTQRNAEFRIYMTRLFDRYTNPEVGNLPFFQYLADNRVECEHLSEAQYNLLYPVISNASGTLKTDICAISYNDAPADMRNSDFLMRPTKACATPPLVLPAIFTGTAGDRWTYVDSEWDPQTRIIDADCSSEIASRRLPKNGADSSHESSIKYPWVSNCDFFYDNLLDLGYEINTEKFYAPAFVENGKEKQFPFLLPIKETWFRYFTVKDLEQNLRIVSWTDDSIMFELSVPLVSNKGRISLKREYRMSGGDYKWIRMRQPVDIGVFPFYRIENSKDALKPDPHDSTRNEYSVYLYDSAGSARNSKYAPSLKFLNVEGDGVRTVVADSSVRTSNAAGKSTVYNIRYDEQRQNDAELTRFDIIEFSALDAESDGAIAIPRFRLVHSHGDSDRTGIFAIDFGTSNTHISFWDYEKRCARPFEITPEEQQMVLLNRPVKDDNQVVQYRLPKAFGRAARFNEFLREFVPQVIGNVGLEKGVSYPVKTAFLDNPRTIELRKLFISGNIGYDIDNEDVALTQEFNYRTNLKWALQENRDDVNARTRVELYCEQTLWMIKNLLVIRGYSNRNVKIMYFYPESMLEDDKDMFKNAWNKAKRNVFLNCGFTCEEISPEPEAIVPFYSLLKQNGDIYAYNSVNVDIGGGTTDIFFFDRGMDNGHEQGFDTSIFFAANDLWGVSFPSGDHNGFVEYMESQVDKITGQDDLKKLYRNFIEKQNKASLASFFFKHSGFDFGTKIKNRKEFRYILLIHYASIIYYIKDMVDDIRKTDASVAFPRFLTFTGKGSEYVKLLTPEESNITLLTQCLFSAFGVPQEEFRSLKVMYPDNPKTLTADGGVYRCQTDSKLQISFKKADDIFFGEDQNSEKVGTYRNISSELVGFEKDDTESITIGDISDNGQLYKKRIMENFEHFLDAVFNDELVRKCTQKIGIEIIPAYRQDTLDEAAKSLDQHLKRFCQERKGHETDKLSDSLFFLTLKNALIELSNRFYSKMKNNQ